MAHERRFLSDVRLNADPQKVLRVHGMGRPAVRYHSKRPIYISRMRIFAHGITWEIVCFTYIFAHYFFLGKCVQNFRGQIFLFRILTGDSMFIINYVLCSNEAADFHVN